MGHILEVGRNCWVTEPVRASGILIDGLHYYRAFWNAARLARQNILVAGWQFDSDTRLLRGADVRGADQPVRFLDLLDHLCHRNPNLHVYILAWDYNIVYALERERMQRWLFERSTSKRLQFEFDDQHPLGASQHQKFVVVDGSLAFVGGMDICASRWDTRAHLAHDPDRTNPRQESYGPYHDLQGFVVGQAARRVEDLFRERWAMVTGERIPKSTVDPLPDLPFEPTVRLPISRVGLSRTRGRTLSPPREAVGEVRHLYLDSIERAERLIYVENQYFTSLAVYRALRARMRALNHPPLEIVVVLPRSAQAAKEELALGVRQARLLRTLAGLARDTGHGFGVFYPVSRDEDGEEHDTYVHAKVLLVDDRFLSIGSANTTNRSLGLDTELNVTWEAESQQDRAAIREVRVDLLAEHCGSAVPDGGLASVEGLAERLVELAKERRGRLRLHPMQSVYEDRDLLQRLMPYEIAFDPDRAELEENVWEAFSSGASGPFSNGMGWLRRWLGE